jgi:hypothetical protein
MARSGGRRDQLNRADKLRWMEVGKGGRGE